MNDIIRKSVQAMQTASSAEIFWVKVLNVDAEKEKCTVQFVDSELELEEVLLSLNKGGIVAIPKINSLALACSLEGKKTDCFLITCENIETYKLRFDDKIIFGSESFGGFVKIQDLVERLNLIEKAFNDLLNAVKSHNHLVTYGPTTALVVPITIQDLQETEVTQIENGRIKHGE